MKTLFTQQTQKERGVALLFVILLTSVLMLVAIGIANISYKEAFFSVQAKDSDRAFFAADTGIECALYLDGQALFGGGGTATPSCNGYLPSLVDVTGTGNYIFALPLGSQCAEIAVNKNYTASDGSGPYTQISSIGYNVPADTSALPAACVTVAPNPRVVTRALRTRYLNSGGTTTGGATTTGTTGTSGTTTGTTGSGLTLATPSALSIDAGTGIVTSQLLANGGAIVSAVGTDYAIIPTTVGVTQPFTTYGYSAPLSGGMIVGGMWTTFGFPGIPVTSCSTVYARAYATNSVGTAYSPQLVKNVHCP